MVQIFISYAHADNVPRPGDLSGMGFITALHEQLNYFFRNYGAPRPAIWRDARRMDGADQFDDRIAEAISQSALFVAVLSPNWMNSDYCKKELKAFGERWAAEGGRVRERIIVVGKRNVAKERRPSLLQDQTGCLFYAVDNPEENDIETEFYLRGGAGDARFQDRAEDLSRILWRRARRLGSEDQPVVDIPESAEDQAPKRGKVYLAKPATDMENAYARLVTELTTAGFAVVPDPAATIPFGASASDYVDRALADVDMSIHLVGEKAGYTPEGADPIVRLQLSRARQRGVNGGKGVRRLVWAPKFLDLETTEYHDAAPRIPNAVLARFDEYVDGDTVDGDTLSRFVELAMQRLSRAVAPPPEAETSTTGSRVYVDHGPGDVDYAYEVIKALRARDIVVNYPVYEGSDAEKVQHHRRNIRDCDSVLVCWANEPDVWVRSKASELGDWKVLGRSKGFTRRAVVAGPPPGRPKKIYADLYPKNEIDLVLDLTGRPLPQPEDFAPLLASQ